MPSDIERHWKSKQHSEATITTVLSTSEEGRDLLERKISATGAKRRPSNDETIDVSPPKQARIDVEVNGMENVEKCQYPQDKGGILVDMENLSQREDTQEGSVLLIDDNTIYDSINDVLDTVTSGSESELEMVSQSKSQRNIKDFLAPQGKNIRQNICVKKKSDMQTEEGSAITAGVSSVTVLHQSNENCT